MVKTLEELFEGHLESSGLIPPDSRGIVAVSGGIDSAVLLHLLCGVKERLNLMLGVAHFNHGLRGEQSDDDERFVRGLAEKSGLAFFRRALPPHPSDLHMSGEEYARLMRYRFLEETRSEEGFHWIATGHHGNDQAETVLMRVIEGSGIRGLRGIVDRLPFTVRPLLPFSRDQIGKYAERRDLLFRNDPSNLDRRFKRNFVRHELIPKILELNPSFPSTVSRLSRNVREIECLIESVVTEKRRTIVREESAECVTMVANRLSEEPMIIQKRLVERLVHGDRSQWPWRRSVWENLELFLERSSTGQVLSLPNGWRLLRDRDRFVLQKGIPEETDGGRKEIRFTAQKHVSLSVGHHSFEMDVQRRPAHFSDNSHLEFADFGRLAGRELTLRRWREGDRMKPLGLEGSKKVSDILTDEKASRFEKERQYVLTAEDDIVWLCGVRLDDRFGVRDDTEQVARLCWRQN